MLFRFMQLVLENKPLKGEEWKNIEIAAEGFVVCVQFDNGKDFCAKSIIEFCMKYNITVEYRPVKHPELAGYIEAPWGTINDAIRGMKLPGRVYPILKNDDIRRTRQIAVPQNYDPQKDAQLNLEEFKEWLFLYFGLKFCADTRANQLSSPNSIWKDGLVGENFQPMGGALRVATKKESERINYEIMRGAHAQLSQKGLCYKNIYYTSPWLLDARKTSLLKDKTKIEFRISNNDIRYIYVLNPRTSEIERLTAYSYNGDSRIRNILLRAVGKVPGALQWPISMSMMKIMRDNISTIDEKKIGRSVLFHDITKKLVERKGLTKTERIVIDNVARTQGQKNAFIQEMNSVTAGLKAEQILSKDELANLKEAVLESLQTDDSIEGFETAQKKDSRGDYDGC